MHAIGKPFTPCIETIAQSLAFTNRYNGSIGTYSVAQHSVLVSRQLPPELRLAGLLHDAPEAYLGDMAAPLKAYCPDFVKLEKFYHDQLDAYFGIETRHPDVTLADRFMFNTEDRYFELGINTEVVPSYAINLTVWSPERAKRRFLVEFDRCLTQ
jgi:hypothetical protein